MVGLSGQSQNVKIELTSHNSKLSKTTEQFYIDNDGQHTVMIEQTGTIGKKTSLVKYNSDMAEVMRVELNNKNINCLGGYVNGSYIDLLVSLTTDTEMQVYRERRDINSLQPVGEKTELASYSGDKNDKFDFLIAVSPNQKLLAALYIADRTLQGVDMKVSLYNQELEEYWSLPTTSRYIDGFHVTDNGDVIITHNIGKYTIIDGEKAEYVEFTVPEEENKNINEHTLVNYVDGKIISAATLSKHNLTGFSMNVVESINTYCFDTKNKTTTVDKHPTNQYECNRLGNNKEGKTSEPGILFNFSFCQTLADKDGAYLMGDESWKTESNSSASTFTRYGIMILRIDNIQWSKAMRLYQVASFKDKRYLNQNWVRTTDGIMTVKADNASNAEISQEKKVKQYNTFQSNSMLTVMTLDAQGNEKRSYMPIKNQAILGSVHLTDTPGQFIAILNGTSKGQAAKITIE